ncbi:MAG TPA: hypothetical protein VJY15_17800 [Candidatus Acidoferrum sp.]|nr:hypothetical protein [Candidatus Acidoferrum sp.]
MKWRRAWYSAFGAASSRRAAAQVRQVVHAQTLGDIEDRHALELALEERAAGLLLAVD